jgi:quercetin dioxygenase-like cupin family protein
MCSKIMRRPSPGTTSGKSLMSEVARILLNQGVGELLWYDGGLITFKATGAQTAGALLMFEAWMPKGKATPLHVHPESDESFYVIEGSILTRIADEERPAETGAVVHIPRGVPHAFAVKSESARLFVVVTPASTIVEAFFRAGGEPAPTAVLPDPSTRDPVEGCCRAVAIAGFGTAAILRFDQLAN